MAGNPYTESGEVFKIPDMLANRADIYNLGMCCQVRLRFFTELYRECDDLQYGTRTVGHWPMEDFYLLAEASQGKPLDDGFKHPYSAAETKEIIETLKIVRDPVRRIEGESAIYCLCGAG